MNLCVSLSSNSPNENYFVHTYFFVASFLQILVLDGAPAIANDAAELQFIQDQERLSSDDRTYWIGGLAYQTVESQGQSGGK